MRFRSAEWFFGRDELGFQHRSALRAMGIDVAGLEDRPIIGIANSWSELNNCNLGLREVAQAVKKGVIAAGGLPLEFPTISLGEEFTKPTAMLYRNLMAMDVEEMLRSNPIDGVVLLCNCDKTIPAQLMGAASANLPALQINGGPRSASLWRGVEVGSGTDLWKYWDDYRAGHLSDQDLQELEECFGCGVGACNVMGTASTMAGISEALGMMPWGTSTICATDSRRLIVAEVAGRQAVELVLSNVRPTSVLTRATFENAIRVCMALGGSTNAILHLIAIAGRVGIDLTLDMFDQIAAGMPCLANVKPSGKYLVTEFHVAGGVPAVMKAIEPQLDGDCPTVNGKTVRENLSATARPDGDVIRTLDRPVRSGPTMAVLRGTLAPNGAILKVSAATPSLLRHTGKAVVFENYQDMLDRVDREDLEVTEDSVLVLKNCGSKGAPGMPEWGALPIPVKLQKRGVRDMVRISDARMSGTAYGTVLLHVSPEAAAGGPLAVVESGDEIVLDVERRRLDLLVPPEQIDRRLEALQRVPQSHLRGYPRLYIDHVLPPEQGCDFDFLRPATREALVFVPPVVGRS